WAYRTLDAQYFGVPQRRRRIFVVGYLGDWRCAASVLFERHSLSGDSSPSREERASVAGSLTGSLGRRCGVPDGGDAEGQLIKAFSSHGHGQFRPGLGMVTARDHKDGFLSGVVAHTLRADGFDASEDGTGRGAPLVPVCVQEDNQNGIVIRNVAGSLRADARGSQPCGSLLMVPTPIDMRQASRGEKLTNNRATGNGGPPGSGVGNAGDPAFTVSER